MTITLVPMRRHGFEAFHRDMLWLSSEKKGHAIRAAPSGPSN